MAVSSCRLPEHGKVCFISVKASGNTKNLFLDPEYSGSKCSQLSHDANCIMFAPQWAKKCLTFSYKICRVKNFVNMIVSCGIFCVIV